MLDVSRIQAITLDLDDTLWPIWPTIGRAEAVLHAWLAINAPATAALYAEPAALRAVREQVGRDRPDLKHDLSALRVESLRLALRAAGDDPALAEPAFDVFFAERQAVTLFDDALPGLEFLAARYPVVSLSNGNADLVRVGIDRYFAGAVTARDFGIPKPDRRIFEAAAAVAGVPPQAVLHVGDDVLLDVIGAREAGMQVAWANRTQALWPAGHPPAFEFSSFVELCDALR